MCCGFPNLNLFKTDMSAPFYIDKNSLWQAHEICMVNKKSTTNAVLFRIQDKEEIESLYESISSGTYYPGTSIAFITENREVFAANYKDRVVHTWASERMVPLLEQQLIPNTFNCRKGKGVLAAIASLREQIRILSNNYTKRVWIMIYDLSGFFMNIDREKAARRLCRFIEDRYTGEDKETLLWITRTIITHAPEKDCVRMGDIHAWDSLPERKSLFYHPGLPIGNLPSQLDANLELDIVDHYVSGLFYYDRYADDSVMVSENKEDLLNAMPKIREMLKLSCGAVVNPKKYKLIPSDQGFKYLGVIINKDKAYPSGRTVGRAYDVIRHYNKKKNKEYHASDFMSKLNSYLGLMKHFDTDETRAWLISKIDTEWFKYIKAGEQNEKITLVKKPRTIIKNHIRSRKCFFNQLKYSIRHANITS